MLLLLKNIIKSIDKQNLLIWVMTSYISDSERVMIYRDFYFKTIFVIVWRLITAFDYQISLGRLNEKYLFFTDVSDSLTIQL